LYHIVHEDGDKEDLDHDEIAHSKTVTVTVRGRADDELHVSEEQ
jgi:hypothetical protein